MEQAINWLQEPWTFTFMQKALLAGIFVALTGAVVGTFVVIKGLAFLSEAVAHSSMAGAAVAFLIGGGAAAISIGAIIAAIGTALGVAALTRQAQIREDTATALLFAGLFGFAILLISRARNFALELRSFIAGPILGVATEDLWIMGTLTIVVILVTLWFYRELVYTTYDPEMAAASGVPVGIVQTGLLILVAVAAVIAFRLVGVVLVMAMLVAPAATASLIVRRIPLIMMIGAVLGLVSVVAGLYLSFYANYATGPSIVMIAVGAFGLAFALSPRGLNVLRLTRGGGPAATAGSTGSASS